MPSPFSRFRPAVPAATLVAVLVAALAAALPAPALAEGDAASPKPAAATPPARPPAAPTVDLNTATETELMALPGIGPVVARRILEYRKSVVAFRTVDELLNVRGIGEKTLAQLRPRLTASAPKPSRPPATAGDPS